VITIEITGKPIPWKSHGGFGNGAYNPLYKEMLKCKRQIHLFFSSEAIKKPVKVDCKFYFEPPKSCSAKVREEMLSGKILHQVRPDVTNLWKYFEDCLKRIVFEDDCLVVKAVIEKLYGEIPKTYCTIEEI
jgi:Holliday junction resolvase RusA-like endonuclease